MCGRHSQLVRTRPQREALLHSDLAQFPANGLFVCSPPMACCAVHMVHVISSCCAMIVKHENVGYSSFREQSPPARRRPASERSRAHPRVTALPPRQSVVVSWRTSARGQTHSSLHDRCDNPLCVRWSQTSLPLVSRQSARIQSCIKIVLAL